MTIDQTEITQAVASEVRAQLARHRRSGRSVALELGYTQQSFSRRLTGVIPFNVVELSAIAKLLKVGLTDLLPADTSSACNSLLGIAA